MLVGNIRRAEDIMANLQHILADQSDPPSHPVGYLTSETRDVWSSVREKLASAGMFSYCLCMSTSLSSHKFVVGNYKQ